MKPKHLMVGALMLLLVLILAACQTTPAPAPVEEKPCPTAAPCPDCPACPEPEAPPEPIVKEAPFQEAWASSPHNDVEAEAFRHWDEDDPPEVSTSCAKCHSTSGYQEFVATGEVTKGVPVGETVQCVACHSEAAVLMDSVAFPQQEVKEEGGEPENVVISGLGPEARCMVCHQGRASKSSVDAALEKFGVAEDVDAIPASVEDSTLAFINIHYFPAAATLYGTAVKGGYEYDGKSYDFKNDHVAGYDTCVGCHSPHTLELKLEECTVCHQGVASVEDVQNIRMQGSEVDYDGDGDVEEGISAEVEGLREMLYSAIQAYGAEVAGAPIAYEEHTYPYFFIDTNADGEASEEEATRENGFSTWTARLIKAAYNYQMATKDPGAFAHGGKYIIQLLYDSIDDLNQALSTPVDLSNAHRIDAGHFAGSEEAFRHWDEDGEVEAQCAKCHSAVGLPEHLNAAATSEDGFSGMNVASPLANGLNCATCHDDLSSFTRYVVNAVKMPSESIVTFGEASDSNLCLNCHQGRSSTTQVNELVAKTGVGDDEVSQEFEASQANPHYFAAGASLFGSEAQGAYQYAGKDYNGRNLHVDGFNACLGCHDTHALEVKVETCSACHPSAAEGLETIRMSTVDYDGDGDLSEGMAGEIVSVHEALYTAIQDYAANTVGTGILYASGYPYWFTDTNANGEADADEVNFGNQYRSWTPRLLRAAHNYLWVVKDPGAFAHNGQYILQVLYDTLQDIGADVSAFTRP